MSDQAMKAEFADRIDRLNDLAEAERQLRAAMSNFDQAQWAVVQSAERLQEWADRWEDCRQRVLSVVADDDLTTQKATEYKLADANDVMRRFIDDVSLKREAISALTPAPEAEPGSGHGEIETKLPPPDPFLTELMSKGGTWHDGGPNPAPDKFVDIYVPAASTNLGDRPNYLEGQPSNAYVWTGWEVAYRISEPAGEGETREVIQGEVGREFPNGEGYQHVVDAEPAPVLRADVPPDAVTYLAPSGELFATFNGSTHLVINDPPAEQSEPYSAAHEQDEPALTLDQMDDQGITDPNASAMLRMMTARKLEGVE